MKANLRFSENGLEWHLAKLAETNTQADILNSLWRIHKELLMKVLAAISPIFSSFTDHGPVHSLEIIRCVERILGPERIVQLGATDTWLLLECAFRHDTGMHVSDEEINEFLSSKTYEYKLDELSKQGDSDLSRAARSLLDMARPKDYSDISDYAVEKMDTAKKINLVLQEYFRSRHAARSSEAVSREHSSSFIAKDSDSLVQSRLWKLVAQICNSHSGDSTTPNKTLPYTEEGYCSDDAHPRFIAHMLRIGDLLDLDNNRINPNMLALWGKELPDISRAHILKHTSIEHLFISPEKIEATARLELADDAFFPHVPSDRLYDDERAEYKEKLEELAREFREKSSNRNMKGIRMQANSLVAFLSEISWSNHKMLNNDSEVNKKYQRAAEDLAHAAGAIESWFGWIEENLEYIAKNQLDILPKNLSGSVPRFTRKEILFNNHKFNNSIINLSYKISHTRAANIIMGTGLYGFGAEKQEPRSYSSYNPELVFIREFIQNAMDATKVQAFRYIRQQRYEKPTDFYYDKSTSKYANKFHEWNPEKVFTSIGSAAEDLRVDVRVRYFTKPNNDRLVFVFQDYGIGIDGEALRYMSDVGSTRSPSITREIQDMPDWLKPGGSFGIGMQSAFGVVKKFRASSWSRRDYRNRDIYFYHDDKAGKLFAIDKESKNMSMPYKIGTKFVVALKDEDIEKTSLYETSGKTSFKRDIGFMFEELKIQFRAMLSRDLFPLTIRFFIDGVELLDSQIKLDPLFPIKKDCKGRWLP